jgi:hypothetical protein
MSIIDYTDVETDAGRPISDPAEQAQVTQWIADVEMILTARLGDLTVIANQALLSYVIRESVIARMKVREDRNSEAPQSTQSFFLGVLDPWWALLELGDTADVAAGTIRPSFAADTAWWPAKNPTVFGSPGPAGGVCGDWDYIP